MSTLLAGSRGCRGRGPPRGRGTAELHGFSVVAAQGVAAAGAVLRVRACAGRRRRLGRPEIGGRFRNRSSGLQSVPAAGVPGTLADLGLDA